MRDQKVYILLTDTGSLLTKLIKLYTNKPYNHASISFDSALTEAYSFGRKNINNPFDGGFVKEDVTKGLFEKADCAIYSFTVSEVGMQNMRDYIKELERQKEFYRYNFFGLFGFLLNMPIERKNSFFCSQFVATILKKSNSIYFEKQESLIAPNDFQEIPEFKLVYEGMLKDYHNKNSNKVVDIQTHFIPVGM